MGELLCVLLLHFLQELARCLGGKRLQALIQYQLGDWRHRAHGGLPDLVLWNRDTGYLRVVEVKGPGDQLSVKQRLWLDWFARHDVDAQVCHVKAISNRALVKTTTTNKP